MKKWSIDEITDNLEKPFDYGEYEACSIMYLDESYIHFSPDTLRYLSYNGTEITTLKSPMKISACCVCNEEKTKLLKWGHDAFKGKKLLKNGEVYLDNFLSGLHCLYKKLEEGKEYDDQDIFLSNAVAKCFEFFVARLRKLWIPANDDFKNKAKFHFVFVVPTEWVPEIREKLLRPIFIQAGIINESDHKGRLQFYTKLECHLQMAQLPRREMFHDFMKALKKERHGVQLELDLKSNIISVTLDIFEAKNSTLASKSTLIPKVVHSANSEVVDWKDIRSNLERFLRKRGVFVAEAEAVQRVLDHILTVLSNHYLLKQKVDGEIDIADNKTQFPFDDLGVDEWGLTDTQKDNIKLIDMAETYQLLFLPAATTIMVEIENALTYSNYSEKRPVLLSLLSVSNETKRDYDQYYCKKEEEHDEAYVSRKAIFSFSNCVITIAKEKARKLHDIKVVDNDDKVLTARDVIMGASSILTGKIKVSNMLFQPSIIHHGTFIGKKELPTEYLSNLQPDIIVNIDLSYTKVSYSCAFLDSDHRVKSIINNDIDADECLNPPNVFLKEFDICKNAKFIGELRVHKWIVDFMNNNFADAIDYFSRYDRFLQKNDEEPLDMTQDHEKSNNLLLLRDFFTEKIVLHLTGIKDIFREQQQINKQVYSSKFLVSKQQQKFVKVFLMIFLGFLKSRVYCQLKNELGDSLLASSKISYLISVEKMFLGSCIGTKDDLKELTIASGILQESDDPKKVQIITQGEGLIPRLQQKLNIDLPLKSYYVQVQLHESYIQLTLYRLMKQSSSLEEEAAAVIIMDKVISMENMYTSLGKYMWNSIQLHPELIYCCGVHEQRQGFESFMNSTVNYKRFKEIFKQHIQKNMALLDDLDLATKIELSSECKCHIKITPRDIIEIAFNPVLIRAVSVVSAALLNKYFFGHYDVLHLFFMNGYADYIVSGPIFKKALDMEIENIWADNMYGKEIQIQHCSVLDQSIRELTRQTVGELPFLFDCFTKGRLHQVSSKLYALNFGLGSLGIGEKKYCYDEISYKNDGCGRAITIPNNSYSIAFLNEGQIIPNEGINKTIYFRPTRDIREEQVFINLLEHTSINQQEDLIHRKDIISYKNPYAKLAQMSNNYITQWSGNLPIPLTVKIRPNNNHNFSLHFSVQFPCYEQIINDCDFQSFEIEQRLTLDYV